MKEIDKIDSAVNAIEKLIEFHNTVDGGIYEGDVMVNDAKYAIEVLNDKKDKIIHSDFGLIDPYVLNDNRIDDAIKTIENMADYNMKHSMYPEECVMYREVVILLNKIKDYKTPKIKNDEISKAIEFIKRQSEKCKRDRDFNNYENIYILLHNLLHAKNEKIDDFGITQDAPEIFGNIFMDKDDPMQPHYIEFSNKKRPVCETSYNGDKMIKYDFKAKWVRFDIKHKTILAWGITTDELNAVKNKAIELWGE